MKTFLTADYHLGESRMELFSRPFKDQKDHVDQLVSRHNSVVAPDDRVIIVGDLCHRNSPEFLPEIARFNGIKTLIRGNHDRTLSDEDLSKYFDTVVKDGEGLWLKFGGIECYATHYPTQGTPDAFNLVGHIHDIWKYQLNMLNVGIDVHNFFPVDSEKIPWHFEQVCKHHDEDVWCAYWDLNKKFRGVRGRAGRYFNPVIKAGNPTFAEYREPDFDEVIEEWKKGERDIRNFCVSGNWAYLMAEGAEQLIARKKFTSEQEVREFYASLGVRHVGYV